MDLTDTKLEERARLSAGASEAAIYRMVLRALESRGISGGTCFDVGCGSGNLYRYLGSRFARYVGVDAVNYADFPRGVEFVRTDLNSSTIPLPAASADVVVSVETIEHLENPRAFVRELARLVKPGGWIIVTTPNQLSLLSFASLIVKKRFAAFQDVHYPAHLSALLEVDLRRIAAECETADAAVEYSHYGRIPLTARHFPAALSRLFPGALSDNILLAARKVV